MKTDTSQFASRSLVFNYGIAAAGLMVVWFLTTDFFQVSHRVELRALNFGFEALMIFLGIRQFKRLTGDRFHYFSGLAIGLQISAVMAVAFTGFMTAFMTAMDPAFLVGINAQMNMTAVLTAPMAAGLIFFELLMAGLLCTFISMQWLKRPIEDFNQIHP